MNKIQKIIGGIVVIALVVVLGAVFFHKTAAPGQLGDQVQNDVFWFTNGAKFGTNADAINWVRMQMGVGTNQISWLNNTGNTVFIPSSLAKVSTNGTASTTYAITMGTSTAATVTDAQTAPVYGSMIDGALIATSTVFTTVSNIQNSTLVGTKEQGYIRVPAGQHVIAVMENPYKVPGTCTGATCENATSTNRGFSNVNIDFMYLMPTAQ